ncbi:MAG: L-erythro-3,5-diaminohexanoate dehydrogenase [Myxococcales bacterium]|nr:L-erythro-3,5-diaminohexanoate dehydrogenase [Myxococcales bacterium]
MSRPDCRFGSHRVIAPAGALPQAAERLDPSLPARENEILIAVDTLNIDSASFAQIAGEVGHDGPAIAERVRSIVASRGKMQNPVTGSGGMLLGRVTSRGPAYDTHPDAIPGARVATLVSLTLTPLQLDEIRSVRVEADQVEVRGHAMLPPSAPLVVVPSDLDERTSLSALDVCGAPAQVARLAKPGMRVVVLGAGKSGLLCMAQARDTMGSTGRIVGVDLRSPSLEGAKAAGLIDAWATCDARDPLAAYAAITGALGGEADLVVNAANVADTEMASILAARDGGTVYFFNMATSFSRAALGAEGVGKDATLIIGNGFAPGHAALTLDLVRRHPFVRQTFERLGG